MGRSHKIPAALALVLTLLAGHTIGPSPSACLGAAAFLAAPVDAQGAMPISKVWRPGGVVRPAEPPMRAPRAALATKPRRGPATNKIDLNSCTLEQLQNLPGVGPSLGAHIMAGRPYRNFDDLARDGVPLSTIDQIRALVKLGP